MRDRILLALLPLLVCSLSCSGPDRPRSRSQIQAEREKLPGLYITESGKRITAPMNKGMVLDESSGEIAWPAHQCTNPNCPAREGDDPHLFIWPDPRFEVIQGAIQPIDIPTLQELNARLKEKGFPPEALCPECLKNRDPASETSKEQQQYRDWSSLYVLPETAERQKALDEEAKARKEYIKRRISGAETP